VVTLTAEVTSVSSICLLCLFRLVLTYRLCLIFQVVFMTVKLSSSVVFMTMKVRNAF